MRIVDHDKFNRRVKLPAVAVLFLSSLALAGANIYFYGYPVTGFVALLFVGLGAIIIDSMKENNNG